jgi:hypothetical protein
MTVEERFWTKVGMGPLLPHMDTPCWVWTDKPNIRNGGYGKLNIDRRPHNAHRVSYELAYGKCPEGHVVDHRCRNKICVRPEHLRAATRKQNAENLSGANAISKSGVLGVSPSGKRWQASVKHHGQQFHLGRFNTIAEAEEAVVAKRLELYTHNDLDRALQQQDEL